MSSIQESMDILTAQWYNATVTGLGLSPDQFQLYQGTESVMSTSPEMWAIFNAIPPKSINNYYNPSQNNQFTGNYDAILSSLKPASNSDFVDCMGDYYSAWSDYFTEYLKNNPLGPDVGKNVKTITSVFNNWAAVNAPGKAGCLNGLTKIYIDPINQANLKFATAEDKYAWDRTIDNLNSALASAPKKTFSMDSKTQSSEVKHTWAGGNTSFFFDIFSFGGGASYDKLSQKVTTSGLNIDVTYDHVTTFAAGPLNQASTSPVLKDYSPWYLSAALALAYQTKDNTVWSPTGRTSWEKEFGENGTFQRTASSIVAVNGITSTMTSTATFDKSEQETIKGAAKAGIWPFFNISGSGGSETTVTFSDEGTFTIKTTLPLGNPQIIGVLQSPMSKQFG